VSEKVTSTLFCLLFAVLFGGVGAGASWVFTTMVYDGVRAQEWVRVKAEVVGESSYRYTLGGATYTSDRLGTLRIGGTSDVDDFDERVASILARGRDERKPITVWVNPDDPREAMIDREIRWMLLVFITPFAVAFGGVGVGALWYLVHNLRGPSKRAKVVRAGSSGSGAGGLWFFALMWNAIAFPIAILAVPQGLRDGDWLILLVLLFPLIGVLVLWSAIVATFSSLRRGRGPAEPKPVPEPARKAAATPDKPSIAAARAAFDDPRVSPDEFPKVRTQERIDPSLEQVLGRFDSNGLTPQQREAFAQLTPEQQKKLGKVLTMLPSGRKIIIAIVCIWVAIEVVPMIYSLVR